MLRIAFFLALIFAPSFAFAQCANGYSLKSVPLCQQTASGGPIIGDTNIEPKQGNNSNFISVQGPYTTTAAQTLTDMSMYTYTGASAGNVLAMAVYDNTGPNGTPGKLLGRTAFFAPGQTPGWQTKPIITPVNLPPGTYYPAWISLNNVITLGSNFSAGKTCWAGTYNYFQNPFPQTSPAGNGCETGQFSVCANCSGVIQNPSPPLATNCSTNPPTTQAGANQMAIFAPCSSSVAVANQATTPGLIDIGISDANATVPAGNVPISVKAMGAGDVEVWTHGAMATRLTPGANGMFTGTLNLSSEPAGPLHVMFQAWDVTPPATPALHLQGEMTLFVQGTRPAIPTPAPASGMTLAFSDHFTSLNALPCAPGTGTWPKCKAPSASQTKWYENLFNGQDFGDCANEHTDGTHNPFTILPQGGLRIRNQYDPAYIDPYGFGRTQYCGVLSTGFKDGSNSLPITGDGYYDARILVPNGACGAAGNNVCSGGTWPSFWMLSFDKLSHAGSLEMDEMEEYGNDTHYFQGFIHASSPAVLPDPKNFGYAGYPDGDLTWDFHTVGMLITGSGTPSGQVCNYFDEVQVHCAPMPQYAGASASVKPAWSMMLELASGGGWVQNPPPANQYDLFVDWVAVWH